jgi:PAS domain-containing protein
MQTLRMERRFLLGAAVAVCLAIVVAAGYAVLQLRQGVQSRLNSTTQNLAVSVGQTVEGLVDMIDVALLASADEIARQRASGQSDSEAILRYLNLQAKRLPHVAFLRGTDASGDLVYGPGRPSQLVNYSERSFFTQLRDDPAFGLYMAKPVVGKISAAPVITFARRINSAHGRFLGTVYASIYVDEFKLLLAQMQIPTGGSIALRDKELSLFARHVFGADNPIPTGSAKVAEAFALALQRNPLSGTYVSDGSSTDPVLRTYSYQSSTKYPFLVVVGLPTEQAFAEWRQQALLISGMASLLAVTVLFLVRQIIRSRSRLEALVAALERSQDALENKHRQLAQSEQQHLALLKNLHVGVLVHAADGRIVFCNTQACLLLGLTEGQLLGHATVDPAWCFVDTHGLPLAPTHDPMRQVMRSLQPFEDMTLGVQAADGRALVWLEVSAFPELAPDGSLH